MEGWKGPLPSCLKVNGGELGVEPVSMVLEPVSMVWEPVSMVCEPVSMV